MRVKQKLNSHDSAKPFTRINQVDIQSMNLNMIFAHLPHVGQVTIPRQSRGLSNCEPLKAAKRGR